MLVFEGPDNNEHPETRCTILSSTDRTNLEEDVAIILNSNRDCGRNVTFTTAVVRDFHGRDVLMHTAYIMLYSYNWDWNKKDNQKEEDDDTV